MTVAPRIVTRVATVSLLAAVGFSYSQSEAEPEQPACTIQVFSGNHQTGGAGSPLPMPVVFRVSRTDGAPISGSVVRFRAISGGGQVGASEATSDAQGVAGTTWTAGDRLDPLLKAETLAEESRACTAYAYANTSLRMETAWISSVAFYRSFAELVDHDLPGRGRYRRAGHFPSGPQHQDQDLCPAPPALRHRHLDRAPEPGHHVRFHRLTAAPRQRSVRQPSLRAPWVEAREWRGLLLPEPDHHRHPAGRLVRRPGPQPPSAGDPEGGGRTGADVRALLRELPQSHDFPAAFATHMGMSVGHLRDNLRNLLAAWRQNRGETVFLPARAD